MSTTFCDCCRLGFGWWSPLAILRSQRYRGRRTWASAASDSERICHFARSGLLVVLLSLAFGGHAQTHQTNLKGDERIVFYPSVAQPLPGQTDLWRTTIRGCVYELADLHVPDVMTAFGKALNLDGVDLSEDQNRVFQERARLFLVDHERHKQVFVRVGGKSFFGGESGQDGRFSAEIVFPGKVDARFTAILTQGDQRKIEGQLFPQSIEGVSVVSDIDDTIKITNVNDLPEMVRNTFLREFQPVPGMAKFYQALAKANQDAVFHYISASPWQLYEPLAAFVVSNGFPAGTFELKQFRWTDHSFFSLFSDPKEYKLGAIRTMLQQSPRRRFILIGDSGEKDPEAYAELAHTFPGQITHIYIRSVTDEPRDAMRYRDAFQSANIIRWQIFRDPSEIEVTNE